MEEKTEQEKTTFFLDELARMDESVNRKYASLSDRLDRLERGRKSFEEDDPMKSMGMIIGAIMVLQVVSPIVEILVSRWASRSSSD